WRWMTVQDLAIKLTAAPGLGNVRWFSLRADGVDIGVSARSVSLIPRVRLAVPPRRSRPAVSSQSESIRTATTSVPLQRPAPSSAGVPHHPEQIVSLQA